MNRVGLTGLALYLVFVVAIPLYGQESSRDRSQQLELIGADVLSRESANGTPLTLLIGNVVLRQGDTELRCDRATYFITEERYLFEGHVRITEPGQTLESSRVIYLEREQVFRCERPFTLTRGDTTLSADTGEYRKTVESTVCRGRVRYEDGHTAVQGDSACYSADDRTIDISGNVQINIPEDQMLVTGETALFLVDSQWTRVTGDPRLERRRGEGRPSLQAVGDTIVFVQSPFYLIIAGHAEVTQGALEAYSDSALYSRTDDIETIALRGAPKIRHRRQNLVGHTIDVSVRDDTVRQVVAVGRAEARMPADGAGTDSLMNIVQGSTITLFFHRNQVERLTADRNAEGQYYEVTDGLPDSGTLVRGELITVLFDDDRFTRVLVDGGGTGTYYPSHLLQNMTAEEPTENVRQR